MAENLDANINKLNKVLDTVNEALVDISHKREEQNKTIHTMSEQFDSKIHIISEKNSMLETKLYKVEENIILIQKSLDELRLQYEENNRILEGLRPKIGKKRSRFWLRF
jgi:hypothetical protein